MKDVVVGCITNYNFDKIKYWVNSLDRSGFTGDKMMICYDIGPDVIHELEKRNYKVIIRDMRELQGKPFNICLQRFYDLWLLSKFVSEEDYRYIISTDVKDVIFQSNPSHWLEKNIGDKKVNVACESLVYDKEPWGQNNMLQSFGVEIFMTMANKLIYNAGTLSGDYKFMTDLFLNLYLICGRSPENVPGGGGPDQAALNVLLQMQAYKSVTNYAMSEDGWAAQLGTTADPNKIASFMPNLVEPTPIMKDGLVCTSIGKPFALVHQYDRVPNWKAIIEKKYG